MLPRALTFSTLLVTCAAAQGGYVLTYDSGCNGDPVATCVTVGPQAPQTGAARADAYYAYPVTNTTGQPIQITGVELFAGNERGSTENVGLAIHEDAGGPAATTPTQPALLALALGSVTHYPVPRWSHGAVVLDRAIPPATVFWIVHECYRGNPPSEDLSAPTGAAALQFDAGTGTWSASGIQAAYRVRCTTVVRPVPVLAGSARNAPIAGAALTLSLTRGAPLGPAFTLFELERLTPLPVSLPLGAAGAPGCSVLPRVDAVATLNLNAAGAGSWQGSWPYDPALRGIAAYAQVVVPVPGANALGLITSNSVVAWF